MRVLQSRPWAPAWLVAPPSLTPRALLCCSLFITCGFFIFCCIVLLDAREDAARQSEQAAWNIVAVVEQDVARNIELFDRSLHAANDGLLLPGIWDFSPQVRNMLLFDHMAEARYLGFVNALNEYGDVIADSQQVLPRGGNYAGRDYFIFHRHDPGSAIFIGRPFGNTPGQTGNITVSRRMSHPDGTFAGVVVGSIKLDYFRDLFARLDIGSHGAITLARTDGTILMRVPYDANDIARTIGPASVFYQFLRTREPRIEAISQVDHVLRRFHYKQIGDLPLVLSVGFAVDDIFAAWRVKAERILLLVAALCLANVGLAMLLRRQLLQRAAAETAARQSAARFRRLTENVSDIVAQIDDGGVYRYVSPASLRVLGFAPEALIGRRLVDDLHPDDRAAVELWLARLQNDAASPTIRFRKRRIDGSDVWIEASATRLTDGPSATPQGFVVLSRDVTARHLLDIAQSEHARELEQNNARLATLAEQHARAAQVAERAVAAKTRFLATMSHEVRTLLNSILGYAELLALEGNLDPVQAGRLAALHGAGLHLRDVVNHVLDYSRVDAEAAQPTPARTDLAALIEQCRAQIEPAAAAKGLRFCCRISADVPHTIFVDGTHLRQVLINLLQNAVKYTRRGEIMLQVSGDADRLRCNVTDTGVGIPANQRGRLFHEYERLDAERAGIEGTGLGLTIAARLVDGMGGQIGYDDNPAGGSVFWLEVPIASPPAEPAQTVCPGISETRSLRVLVVDDSAANRDVAASFLRSAGHDVTEAAGGEEAVSLAGTQDFDVALMDMRMPHMDGLETTRCIRALPGRHGRLPIIAVTAQVLNNHWTAWSAAGLDEYLAKPYERAELLAAVARAALPHVQSTTAAQTTTAANGPPPAQGMTAAPVTDSPQGSPVAQGAAGPQGTTVAQDAAGSHGTTVAQDAADPLSTSVTHSTRSADGTPAQRSFAVRDTLAVLDSEIVAQLVKCLAPEKIVSHLDMLASEIETMLRLLREDADSAGPEALEAITHKVAGDSGQLGFMALSSAAREFDLAYRQDRSQRPKLASALRDTAGFALEALRQRRDFICRAAMTAAKLPSCCSSAAASILR